MICLIIRYSLSKAGFMSAPRMTLFCLLSSLCVTAFAHDWAQFQGPRVIPSVDHRLPLSWDTPNRIAWTAEITGYGQSSPVTFGEQVFVTSISGAKKERCHVAAFEIASGRKRWQHDFDAATQTENNNYVSKAAPTPVVDATGVVCFFEGGNLLSLTHDGRVRWSRNLVIEFGPIESRHGLAASLEQTADRVFVWVERAHEPYVLGVEKKSGKDLWKSAGLGVTSWASPRLVPVQDKSHLVLSGSGAIAGLDPQTGKSLWRFAGIKGNSTPTPQPLSNGRFLIGASVGRGEGDAGKAAESNGLVGIAPQADGTFQVDFIWRAQRATSSFGSPIIHHGHAYFVNATGVLFCLDLETGEERYSHRIADSIWATPVVASNGIGFFGKSGKTSIVAPGSKFELIGEKALVSLWDNTNPPTSSRQEATSGPVVYSAVILPNRLLLRTGNRLICLTSATSC